MSLIWKSWFEPGQEAMQEWAKEVASGDRSVLLPWNEGLSSVMIPVTIASFVLTTTLYIVGVTMPHLFLQPLGLVSSTKEDSSLKQRRKAAFDVANFVVIVFLTVLGLFLQWTRIGHLVHQDYNDNDENSISHRNRAIGFGDDEHMLLLPAVQLGWQFWALPVGLWIVGEPLPMMAHHVSVILCAAMTGCCTAGFRFYAPYFYGILELSSIPLWIMNLFKQRPAWKARYPQTYAISRGVFAVSFLILRVVLFLTRYWDLVRLKAWHIVYHPFWPWQIFYSIVLAGGVALLFLQLYWSMLIVKGLLAALLGKKNKKE